MGPSNTFWILCFLIAPHSRSVTSLFIVTGSSHGQFCNESTPCITSALLTCQDFTCQCILLDSMIFIPSSSSSDSVFGNENELLDNNTNDQTGHCVSLVGEVCGQMSMNNTLEIDLDCVNNSFCNSQGECECHSTHFKSEFDGLCHVQRGFGEECHNSMECSQSLGLACVNETCQCNSTVSIDSLKFFDEDEGHHRCLGRPLNPCLNGQCVPNAICKESSTGTGNTLNINTCICQAGFEESKKKNVCVGTFNQSCDSQSNRFCRKDLSCIKGLCGCKHPANQIYDKDSKTCKSLVGGRCSNNQGVSCVDNAICKQLVITKNSNDHVDDMENAKIYGFCVCGEGFVENINRTCSPAYGKPCSQILEEWKCDTISGLTCRDGFCSCPDPGQTFDQTILKCKGLVGSFCTKDYHCIRNAHCKLHRNGILPFGQCECDDDYEITRDLNCNDK